ncbi:hypothetical protein [Bacillus cereus]|nr:hypothetical protein [Bacillus cereus]
MDKYDLYRKLDEHIKLVIEKSGATEKEVLDEWVKSIEETNKEVEKM